MIQDNSTYAGATSWSDPTSWYTTTTTTTPYLPIINEDSGTLSVKDIELQGLGSVKELLTHMELLIPPPELNTDNSAVMDGLKSWYQALQELRHQHAHLKMLIKLTDETC